MLEVVRRRLYYGHPKFGQVRLPTNAAKERSHETPTFLTTLDSKQEETPLPG